MAQLLNTSIAGTLSVTGNVTAGTAPSQNSHLTNKQYVDTIGKVWDKDFTIANPSTYRTPNSWHSPCSDSLQCTLTKGTYLMTSTFTVTSKGQGGCVVRTCDGSTEFMTDYARSSCFLLGTGWYPSANFSVVFEVTDASKTFNFHPEVVGTTSWCPTKYQMKIVKLTAGQLRRGNTLLF